MLLMTAILLYALWSSVFPLGKIATQYSSPIFLTAFRMLFASILILGFLAIKDKKAFLIEKKQWFALVALGFFSIYLANVLEFTGLKHLPAAKTCFIYSLSPIFTLFLSYIHFKEKITWMKALGILIGLIGIAPVIFMQEGASVLDSFLTISFADLAVIGAAFFSVYGWVILRLIVKDTTVSPLVANGISMFIGGSMALLHSYFADSWTPFPFENENFLPLVKAVALMSFVSNLVCYNIYGFLLKKFTATFLSFLGLLSPIFASLYSWVLLGEPISMTILYSTGIVLCGMFLVLRAEKEQGYIPIPERA